MENTSAARFIRYQDGTVGRVHEDLGTCYHVLSPCGQSQGTYRTGDCTPITAEEYRAGTSPVRARALARVKTLGTALETAAKTERP